MIRNITWAALGAVGVGLLLAGCSHPPYPPPTAMVQAIRAARTTDASVIQITPLRDPAVDGYLDGAHNDESADHYQAALQKIDAALKLSPDAPDILQYRAEIEILLRDFPAAEADARRSFGLGSKVGGLCASNWQTVLEIDQSKQDEAGMAAARKARDACHKAGPIRM